MIVRAASGWQTVIADLALILFLITAQAVGKKPATQSQAEERQPPASSSALAVHRPEQGESVREWLIASTTDQRQMATISVGYTPEKRAEALTEAERMLAEADSAGVPARLIATPNATDDVVITVDYLRQQ
jgi:hypothetical protein